MAATQRTAMPVSHDCDFFAILQAFAALSYLYRCRLNRFGRTILTDRRATSNGAALLVSSSLANSGGGGGGGSPLVVPAADREVGMIFGWTMERLPKGGADRPGIAAVSSASWQDAGDTVYGRLGSNVVWPCTLDAAKEGVRGAVGQRWRRGSRKWRGRWR
jgi:hypothetical protein